MVIGLVPARLGSKGAPGKNWRLLGGRTLLSRAVYCGHNAGCDLVAVSTDGVIEFAYNATGSDLDRPWPEWFREIRRPAGLATDSSPMIDVVEHALQQIPGQPDDIIVLLQPTQPFRTPEHIRKAIALLHESGADSVVSVVPLPLTHSPSMVGTIGTDGYLWPWVEFVPWPSRRQDAVPAYKRDGTVYCFRRKTVATGSIYGEHIKPLILDPSESCELDTESDWMEAERRWKERHGTPARS